MIKKRAIENFRNIIYFFIVNLILIYILNPSIVFGDASGDSGSGGGTKSQGASYTELKSLIEELEENPELASAVYTSLGAADKSTTRPNKDFYGEDEYSGGVAKWAAVVLIPNKDRSDDVENALLESEPFLSENLSNRDITPNQYKKAYDIINNAIEEYNQTIENGGTKENALKKAGDYVTTEATKKAEQDVEDGKNNGVDSWGNTPNSTNNTNNTNKTTNTNDASTLDDIIQKGNDFLNAADDTTNTVDEEDLQNLSKFVSGVLLSVAIGVTILSGVVLGIKYVTQSIEDKAKIKESMIPWIIGILVSFGAFTIWKITINFFQNI